MTQLPIHRTQLERFAIVSLFAATFGCAGGSAVQPPASASPAGANPQVEPLPAERVHMLDLRQLTFGGENAEAYFGFGGAELVLQAKLPGAGCDRIYRMSLAEPVPQLVPVSSGKGATTCSYFMPGDQQIIYASTHLGGDACPPPPDRSQGYVWAIYDSYDIFKANRDGSGLTRLTDTKGYDAEATVCGKDGSIVFTSVRDGDLELYRMDADGQNVRRLTHAPGYDGGAFFNADCSKLVWRASRPRPGKELDDYRALLAQGLVRPTKLELYVGEADGSDATQITYLDAASFAPYWHPSQRRIVFSSNYGDPKGREFDLFAIDENGANLERITHAPGFDGFPMFSPDGSLLAFASNRANAEGSHDTNVFLARWRDVGGGEATDAADETATSRVARAVLSDIEYLAAPAREGRGIGTSGLEQAGAYLERRFGEVGLAPVNAGGGFRQPFEVTTALAAGAGNSVRFGREQVASDVFAPLAFSVPVTKVSGDLLFAGYGIVKDGVRDDYARKNAKGKVVVVRRFVPDEPAFAATEDKRRFGDLRYKAWLAKERGAVGLIVVDDPAPPAGAASDWKAPDEAPFPALQPEGSGDAGIAAVVLKRAAGAPLIAELARGKRVRAELAVELTQTRGQAFNVIGRVAAGAADADKLPGTIVVGAHYDHLGFGGRGSLAPGENAPHVGADDNASGTAALLEIARALVQNRQALRRDVIIAAFSGEESGLLGSAHFVQQSEANAEGTPRRADIFAMINLDMVGRLRDNRVQVLGTETAAAWAELLTPACDGARIECALAGDGGYGPSDQMSFYVAGIPVLHLFTGAHGDYHKPSDTPDKINAGGTAQVAKLTAALTTALAGRDAPLGYKAGARGPAPRGDLRSFNASLGTLPDYGGPGPGKSGVLLSGVRPGGAAEQAGMRRGDILIAIGKHEIRSVEDLMFVLNASHPGETTKAVILREGKQLELQVTFQESARPR
jgi:Tol biopolymer transport system component